MQQQRTNNQRNQSQNQFGVHFITVQQINQINEVKKEVEEKWRTHVNSRQTRTDDKKNRFPSHNTCHHHHHQHLLNNWNRILLPR